ncbi:fimbria/pilus periplasmic chaperone [Klebsiella variicola]|nr:fimbria/pilus periplasmic chaperone [Klebsiella variicola]
MSCKLVKLVGVLSICSTVYFSIAKVAYAVNTNDTEITTKTFSIRLGVSRLIYNPESKGATLSVTNDQSYPILVQSEILSEDQEKKAPFIATPPLFRLDGKQTTRLRVVRTGGTFPSDRESLQWLCVKGIPPKEGDKWAESNNKNGQNDSKIAMQVQFSVTNCIKMFIRPEGIKAQSNEAAGQVVWHISEGKLKATNPTPFYINLSELTVDGTVINDRHYIAPFSTSYYSIPTHTFKKVKWRVINDYGGESQLYESEIK